jgi:aspartate-semialdehyde dehydrogenase
MNPSDLRIAIVGATGAVGQVALQLLQERNTPAEQIVAMASARSAGKKIAYGRCEIPVTEATPDAFDGLDVAFISVSAAVSKKLAPEAVKRGCLVIDDGSAFRMEQSVPLVVPEVNGTDVEWHAGVISIPNCTTTPLVMVLAALRQCSSIRSVTVATYQSVTGTGGKALAELLEQIAASLRGKSVTPSVYPHPIAFNLFPQVGAFLENGYTQEEMKMMHEVRKILHQGNLALSATCVRVPVEISHSEAVHIDFESKVSPESARESLLRFPGITLLDEPGKSLYPTPLQAAGKDSVFVGRVRQDLVLKSGLALWLSCDNLRKGAALDALQILDECVKRGCVKPQTNSRQQQPVTATSAAKLSDQ